MYDVHCTMYNILIYNICIQCTRIRVCVYVCLLPCYLVPSSRNRPLATSMTVPLHITLFLASANIFMMLSLAI